MVMFGRGVIPEGSMPAQAVFAVVFFAMLFVAWVVLPTILRKRHHGQVEEEAN
jgi:cbb3-type cytochrome oxidase subunit 3